MLPSLTTGKGATLSEVLVGMVILAISVLALSTLFHNHQKSLKDAAEGVQIAAFRNEIRTVLRKAATCSCHLNPNLTADDSIDGTLRLDPSVTSGSQGYSLPRISAGCALDSPIVAEVNQSLGDQFRLDSIRFEELRPSGGTGLWEGVWRLRIVDRSGALEEVIEMKRYFTITTIDANNAEIANCQDTGGDGAATNASSALITCPAGMVMMGSPGGIGSYCIDSVARPEARFKDAKVVCQTIEAGFGPGYLCDHSEWHAACRAGLLNSPATEELVDDFDGQNYAVTAGPASTFGPPCSHIHYEALDSPTRYRCCIK